MNSVEDCKTFSENGIKEKACKEKIIVEGNIGIEDESEGTTIVLYVLQFEIQDRE